MTSHYGRKVFPAFVATVAALWAVASDLAAATSASSGVSHEISGTWVAIDNSGMEGLRLEFSSSRARGSSCHLQIFSFTPRELCTVTAKDGALVISRRGRAEDLGASPEEQYTILAQRHGDVLTGLVLPARSRVTLYQKGSLAEADRLTNIRDAQRSTEQAQERQLQRVADARRARDEADKRAAASRTDAIEAARAFLTGDWVLRYSDTCCNNTRVFSGFGTVTVSATGGPSDDGSFNYDVKTCKAGGFFNGCGRPEHTSGSIKLVSIAGDDVRVYLNQHGALTVSNIPFICVLDLTHPLTTDTTLDCSSSEEKATMSRR